MGFRNAEQAEDAAKAALRGCGLKGWRVYGSTGSPDGEAYVLITGPCAYMTDRRHCALEKKWVRLGGTGLGTYLQGAQCMKMFCRFERSI